MKLTIYKILGIALVIAMTLSLILAYYVGKKDEEYQLRYMKLEILNRSREFNLLRFSTDRLISEFGPPEKITSVGYLNIHFCQDHEKPTNREGGIIEFEYIKSRVYTIYDKLEAHLLSRHESVESRRGCIVVGFAIDETGKGKVIKKVAISGGGKDPLQRAMRYTKRTIDFDD